MADENVSQNFSKNPDPQVKPVSGDDITPSQEQQTLPDRLPQSLIDWLARINSPLPGAQPGKDERHQLMSILAAPGLEVC